MVLGARQRRQAEELEQVERQFALDDLDVPHDALGRVGGKAEDVAGIGEAADLLPGQQHRAIFGDAVLLLLRADQAVRIDVLEPEEHPPHARRRRLFDEMGNAVDQRIHLNDEIEVEAFGVADRDQAIENRLPVLVAGQIVVGDEEMVDALREIGANDRLDVVGRAIARLAPLHVDDGAERALERAAPPGIEAGDDARRPLDAGGPQNRNRRALDPRQVAHEIIERPHAAREGVLQHHIEAALGLAGEQRNPERLRFDEIVGHLRQHREAAGDVKPTDGHLHATGAKSPRQIDGVRKLIGLDADQTNQAPAALGGDLAGDSLRSNSRVGLIYDRNLDFDILAEDRRLRQSSDSPCITASVLEGIAERNHWMT